MLRGTAACNLGDTDDSISIPHLIKLAENDSEEKVRSEALSALADYKTDEVLKCLLNEVYREKNHIDLDKLLQNSFSIMII